MNRRRAFSVGSQQDAVNYMLCAKDCREGPPGFVSCHRNSQKGEAPMKAGERIGDKLQSGLPPRSLWLDPLRARAIELSVFMIFFVVGVLLLGSGLLAAYEELRYTSPGTILGCRF